MMNNREQHLKFLDMELIAETEEFDKKFSAKALYLLNESEELFMGQFLKFDNGEMIVRFRATRSFPRKGEYMQVMYLPSKIQDYRQWGDKTYEDLFRNRIRVLKLFVFGMQSQMKRVLYYWGLETLI